MKSESSDLGFWALPEAPSPGIVIIHDVWGLYDHYRELAARLSGEGFLTLALDLYRPLGAVKVEDPGPWMRALSDPDMLARIQVAVDAVRAHPLCSGRVGVVGFCMGGTYTILAAAAVNGIDAAAPFYGILSHQHGLYADPAGLDPAKKPREPLAAARDVRCPLSAFFGEEDSLIPLADVDELERTLKTLPLRTEVTRYPGAGHAFMNDSRPQMYRPEAARDAWARMIEFFRAELGPRR